MLKALLEKWNRHNAFIKTYNELSKLSTRELRDIGIERSMITRIALESSYKKELLDV